MHRWYIILVAFAVIVSASARSEDNRDSTKVEGTFVISKVVASFQSRLVEIRLYKHDPRMADRSADLVEKVELKNFSHTIGKETKKDFMIGTKGELDSKMGYYVTFFILDGDKRTHMGKCEHDKKGIGTVLTYGQPRKIAIEVNEIKR